MASEDQIVSVVALVVSLVALVVTLLQMLQQYYATADGYRRCKRSVVAGWARFTHRRFLASEFRFETTFVVPHFSFEERTQLARQVPSPPDYNSELKPSADAHNTKVEPCDPSLAEATNTSVQHLDNDFEDSEDDEPSQVEMLWNRDWKPIYNQWTKTKSSPTVSFELSFWTERVYRGFTKGWGEATAFGYWDIGRDAVAAFFRRVKAATAGKPSEDQTPQIAPIIPSKVPPLSDFWDTGRGTSPELASWVRLMHRLRKEQAAFTHLLSELDLRMSYPRPVFSGRQKSWDFMAPDVIRPYASISISDLIIMVRLLGMDWVQPLNPLGGQLRAEGRSCVLSSNLVRGLGVVVDIKDVGQNERAGPAAARWFVPSAQVYSMMFGIVPCDPALVDIDLHHRAFRVGLEADFRGSLESFQLSYKISYMAADLVPLVAPMFRQPGSFLVKLPKPWTGRQMGLMSFGRVIRAFPAHLARLQEARLAATGSRSEFLQNILTFIADVDQRNFGGLWKWPWQPLNKLGRRRAVRLSRACDFFLTGFTMAQDRVVQLLQKAKAKDIYMRLVFLHLKVLDTSAYAARYPSAHADDSLTVDNGGQAAVGGRGQGGRAGHGGRRGDGGRGRGGHRHHGRLQEHMRRDMDLGDEPQRRLTYVFEHLPEVCELVQAELQTSQLRPNGSRQNSSTNLGDEKASLADTEIEDLYIAMLFRGMCWTRCHAYADADPAPVEFWRSKQEIYIG